MDAADIDEARKYAERAKARAWCDGLPHCYKLALDEADGLLELIYEQGSAAAAE
jgi:hypothetical protein